MAHIANYSRIACAVLVSLLLASSASASSLPSGHASANKHARKLTPRQKAALRRELARELRRNPTRVFTRAFLRKADMSDFRLPMTVRLSPSDGQGGYQPSDDQLEIDWDASTFSWPTDPTGMIAVPAAPQTIFLKGNFTLEAIFSGGDTSGYGTLGNTETIVGSGLGMSSDDTFDISDFAAPCTSGSRISTAPAAAPAAHAIDITSTGPRYGLMNMFGDTIQGTLSLRMAFASNVVSACNGTAATTQTVDNSAAPPMPVRYQGTFTVSPAITGDGKVRFGKITIDDAATPQQSTFAFVQACIDTNDPCTTAQFPARLKFKKLTAEVLLGSVFRASG